MTNQTKQGSKILAALGLGSDEFKIIKICAEHVKVRCLANNKIADIRF